MMMLILLFLCLFSIFDVATPVNYRCDRRATCGCSKQSVVALTRIVGGEPINIPYSWGWMASLRKDNAHSCGASLLTPWFAITAAHCVINVKELSRISLNFGITDSLTIGQLRNVAEVFIHPSYNSAISTNDVAILRLQTPINLSNLNISVICLPKPSEFDLRVAVYPPVGVNLVAIGWGLTEFSAPPTSVSILRQVTLRSMDSSEPSCTAKINDDVVQFCAGYPEGKRDTCRGDSGGPLMLFKNGRWQLVGITSYGGICGSPGLAGVYTRVAYYDSFIQRIINTRNTFQPILKNIDVDIIPISNGESLFQKLFIKLSLFLLFLVDKNFFFWN